MNRAVFLDRDGTIIEHVAYLTDPAKVRLAPGAAQALRRLRDAGFLLIVVSNQSLVARGLGAPAQAEAVSRRVEELLGVEGLQLDAAHYCFDSPEAPGFRRKPNPGMVLNAARDFDIDLARSAMVGDDPRDVQTGHAAGCGLNLLIEPAAKPDANHVASLSEAADRILAWLPR